MGFRLDSSKYVGSRTSFSGSNIQIAFEDIRIGNIQALSISVSREKAPIYVLGYENPVSFSRGILNSCHVRFLKTVEKINTVVFNPIKQI